MVNRYFVHLHNLKHCTNSDYDKCCFISVLSLQELCCRAIVARTTVYSIEQLPLPTCVKSHLKSYAMTTSTQVRYTQCKSNKGNCLKIHFIMIELQEETVYKFIYFHGYVSNVLIFFFIC